MQHPAQRANIPWHPVLYTYARPHMCSCPRLCLPTTTNSSAPPKQHRLHYLHCVPRSCSTFCAEHRFVLHHYQANDCFRANYPLPQSLPHASRSATSLQLSCFRLYIINPSSKNTAPFFANTWQPTAAARTSPFHTPCPTHSARRHPPKGRKIVQALPFFVLGGCTPAPAESTPAPAWLRPPKSLHGHFGMPGACCAPLQSATCPTYHSPAALRCTSTSSTQSGIQ